MLLIAGLLLFLPLLRGRSESPSRKRARTDRARDRGSVSPAEAGPGEESSVQGSARIDEKDRDEMLDGVRNLARDNPKKVASMVRHWMKE